MSTERAALVIAFDEIAKSRQRMEVYINGPAAETAAALPELRQQVVEIQAKYKPVRQVVLAKGKSHINDDGHLILVYTDGDEEDVGSVRVTPIIRHTPPATIVGGGSGLDRQQVIQIIEATVATSPLIGYRIADEDSDATVKYYGYTATDAKWYIMRVDDTGEIAAYRYANGDSEYSAAWAGRAGLTYALLNELGL